MYLYVKTWTSEVCTWPSCKKLLTHTHTHTGEREEKSPVFSVVLSFQRGRLCNGHCTVSLPLSLRSLKLITYQLTSIWLNNIALAVRLIQDIINLCNKQSNSLIITLISSIIKVFKVNYLLITISLDRIALVVRLIPDIIDWCNSK